MYTVLVVLMVIASVLMCFIVLIQESKGGGLASGFSSSNQIMGVRKTTDVIEKTTWGLAIAMVIISVASSYVIPEAVNEKSVMMKNNTIELPAAPVQQTTPEQNATQAPATPATDAAQQPSTPAAN